MKGENEIKETYILIFRKDNGGKRLESIKRVGMEDMEFYSKAIEEYCCHSSNGEFTYILGGNVSYIEMKGNIRKRVVEMNISHPLYKIKNVSLFLSSEDTFQTTHQPAEGMEEINCNTVEIVYGEMTQKYFTFLLKAGNTAYIISGTKEGEKWNISIKNERKTHQSEPNL